MEYPRIEESYRQLREHVQEVLIDKILFFLIVVQNKFILGRQNRTTDPSYK